MMRVYLPTRHLDKLSNPISSLSTQPLLLHHLPPNLLPGALQKGGIEEMSQKLPKDLVQLVHSTADAAEHVSCHSTDFKDSVQNLSVIYLKAKVLI